jgi:hypothetical protein
MFWQPISAMKWGMLSSESTKLANKIAPKGVRRVMLCVIRCPDKTHFNLIRMGVSRPSSIKGYVRGWNTSDKFRQMLASRVLRVSAVSEVLKRRNPENMRDHFILL